MRILDLEINNFRGIKQANIYFPEESRVCCLIGAGDNTKTTILKAIEWLLWNSWNLSANDNDFYNSDTTKPIMIRGTFTEIPNTLISEDKYGLYLRCPKVSIDSKQNDEPKVDLPICLTIQLTIDSSLEPKWFVVCNRLEPKQISHIDRKQMQLGNIGDNCSRDMVWGKSSILQRYVDSQSTLHQAYTSALREAINSTELKALDEIADIILDTGKQYGVSFTDTVNNKIIMQSGSFSSTVGVFDGNIPLTQRGKGSQRLLSIGLNIQSFSGNTLLLIDEIETGLEPYRLKSLIEQLRDIYAENGQVIMTTHSPVALAECTIKEILIIRSENGKTSAHSLYSSDKDTNSTFQAGLRAHAESFLSKRLIICEGKTEIGFVRSLDQFLYKNKRFRMAHQGIGYADGGGQNIFKCADILNKCGYDICLLMDSDLPKEENEKRLLRSKGISVFDWQEGNAFEEQIFYDATMSAVNHLVNIAAEEKGTDSVRSRLDIQKIKYSISVGQIVIAPLDAGSRREIGVIAKRKKNEWFKRIDLAEQLGNVMFSEWNNLEESSRFKVVVKGLIEWISGNDE